MADAKVSISLSDSTFLFEGSEPFVAAQVEKFADLIQKRIDSSRTSSKEASDDNGADPTNGNGSGSQIEAKELEEVLAASDNGVQILKDLPGNSYAEKTTNAAKLLLLGMEVFKQKDTVLFEEVKAVCKAHGCYDSGHMAGYLKSDKASFITGGSGKKQTLQLTVPGKRAAKKLVEQLKSGTEENDG